MGPRSHIVSEIVSDTPDAMANNCAVTSSAINPSWTLQSTTGTLKLSWAMFACA